MTDAEARKYWTNRGVTINGTRGTVTADPFKAPAQRQAESPSARNSETKRGSHGSTATAVTASLKRLFFSFEKFNKFVAVVDSVDALPATARANFSQASGEVQGFVGTDGKVYLIASNIDPGNELAVFLHEVGVHVGMENMIGRATMNRLSEKRYGRNAVDLSALVAGKFSRITRCQNVAYPQKNWLPAESVQ